MAGAVEDLEVGQRIVGDEDEVGALADLDRIAGEVLPSGIQTDLAGQSLEFASSSSLTST